MICNTISISEHNKDKTLTTDELKKLYGYLKKNKLEKKLDILVDGIKAKNFVGVIKCKNIQIEILPKFIAEEKANRNEILANLIFMLSYTKKLNIDVQSSSLLNKCENPFLEVLIGEFSRSLFEGLKKFSPKNYVRIEENINTVKGKINFTSNIRYNIANQARFYCEYDEFTENNSLNQLFLFVSKALFLISKNQKNKKTLHHIINYYSSIDEVFFDKFSVKKIKLTKNQNLFTKPFDIAKMFIENSSIDMVKNKIDSVSLIWDMNKLFEEFVYEMMRRNCSFNVYQQKGRRLLEDEKGRTYRDTKIDIYAKVKKKKIIIDTKYKEMSYNIMKKLSSSDVYQVSTYCLLHAAKHAVLIYPKWYKDINKDFFIRSDDEKNKYNIKIFTIDLTCKLNNSIVQKIGGNLEDILVSYCEKDNQPL